MNIFFSQRLRQFGKAEQGQALVLVALALLVLLLMAGFGVDIGYLRYQKQQMQKAADAGAIAGASGLPLADWSASATYDASANGFTNGNNNVTVTPYNPPIDPPFNQASDTNYVEVVVSQPRPTFFMQVVGISSVPVGARAVAAVNSSPNCVYVLDPTDKNTYNASGGVSLIASCGLQIDSSSQDAYVDSGGACTEATSINIVGNIQQNNCSEQYPSAAQLTPKTGAASLSDPLALLPAPTVSCLNSPASVPHGCTYTVGRGMTCNSSPNGGQIQPGTYCGGISISAAAGAETFAAGNYILAGGGLTVSGSASTTGTGVFFYNTKAPGGAAASVGSINFSGQSVDTLSAPTTGIYAGILFFQDRTLPAPSATATVSGGSSDSFQGVLYFPTAVLDYSGGSATTSYTELVAWQLNISGGSNAVINSNYGGLPGGVSPIHAATLAQ